VDIPDDDMMIEELCNRLQRTGSAVIPDAGGTPLAFVSSRVLDMDQGPEGAGKILVAWEGKGAFFWNVGSKISPFSLITAGFALTVAPQLARILQRVGECLGSRPGGLDGHNRHVPELEAERLIEERRNGPRDKE